jgi:hypothetical protein
MITRTIAMDRTTTDMITETSTVTRFSREESSVWKRDRRDGKTYNQQDRTPQVWDDPPEREAEGGEEAEDSYSRLPG